MIQDIFPHVFHNEFRLDLKPQDDSILLVFDGKSILLREGEELSDEAILKGLLFPACKDKKSERVVYAFSVDDTHFFLDVSGQKGHLSSAGTEEYVFTEINAIRRVSSNLMGMITFTGYHLWQWYIDSVYCGRCGGVNEFASHERAMHCPVCDRNIYPRIMPAVIIGVTWEDKLLLTQYRGRHHFYALVAGFTEIGETLEETVAREVMEETGLKVKNIRYYKSQPWGIANDMLVGFYCDVDGSTEITMDANELKLAEWKTRSEIELQPDNYSLTNEMMRMFKEGRI